MTGSDVPIAHLQESRRLAPWLALASLLALAVVGWEYLLQAVTHPADWNPLGLAAHFALDLAVVLPLVGFALFAGVRLARRFGMTPGEWAGVLGIAGLVAAVFLVSMLPVVAARDAAHEWMGNTYGLSLAEIQVSQVRSDLTVEQPKQLCSFASLRNPSLAGGAGAGSAVSIAWRAAAAARDLLVQLAVFLPLLLAGLCLRFRDRLPRADAGAALAMLRWWARPLRLGAVGAVALLAFCFGNGANLTLGAESVEAPSQAPYNACEDGGPVKEYNVHAIAVNTVMNRWGDHYQGFMYALEANIPAIRDFEQDLIAARQAMVAADDVNLPGVFRVTPGLRTDPIQPLAIRANIGDCVRIQFTNELAQPASFSVLGLAHTVDNRGSAVGTNPITYAAANGGTATYEIPIPKARNAERGYQIFDHAGGRAKVKFGLFGALVVEPEGATYLDVETGDPLDTVTGSTWEAIIIDPNLAGRPDGKSFREFVIIYHEVGDESQRPVLSFAGDPYPLLDDDELSAVYRPGTRAINYRTEPFRRRIEFNNEVHGVDPVTGISPIFHGKALGYGSYTFGDPAPPIPRSYVGEATKTRLMHAGSEVFHVHHLHGGGDRWRRNPDSDPNSNFWKGLTKVPDQEITSVHLDSQSIGPGSSFNLEHECGAGGCQQGVGDFLYHCHIGHHYIAGMWSFWRVFGHRITEDNDLYGDPLYVEERLFQADNAFDDDEAPSNTPPADAVSAGALIGLEVDWGRKIVADGSFSNPLTQIRLSDWITRQLPPPGVPIDAEDATVWDWTSTGGWTSSLKVWGETEITAAEEYANYVSPIPGQRPEVMFDPKNGRYVWPLFRPHRVTRPPFSPNGHGGAPYLGEDMIPGRYDGLCAHSFVHPEVYNGLTAVKRYYPISAIDIEVPVTAAANDPDGMIFVLNEDEDDIRNGLKPIEPLAIRSNVGDCVEVILTSRQADNVELNHGYSKVNIHSHFVQFDTQASDGVITGMSYEQSVRPIDSEDRTLTQPAGFLSTTLKVNHVDRLRPGVWIGIGLGEGVCGTNPLTGQPLPCTEFRQIKSITAPDTIKLELPLLGSHAAGQAVGVEYVRYLWYPDVDFGTVFFHTHVDHTHWDRGLFGAHIVEPRNSTFRDPATGAQLRAGTVADIHVGPSLLREPVAHNVPGSFREFMMFVHDLSRVIGVTNRAGGGTINLRAEPFVSRPGDPGYRFSSVVHGEPHTPIFRAYAGDPVVVRGMGLIERVGGIRFTGHRFNIERNHPGSDMRDTTFLGISERYDFAFDGGAGGPKKLPGDYLYYNTVSRDFISGGWGLFRVHDTAQGDLRPLPGYGYPSGSGPGFPQLIAAAPGAPPQPPPPAASGSGTACPPGAPVRTYDVAIAASSIVYNDTLLIDQVDELGVAYFEDGQVTPQTRTPLVLRVNKGECLRVNLSNERATGRAGLSVGELLFHPQYSYGAAIGLNHDSTVAAGSSRTYEYYADKELGLTMALNLGDVDTITRGAYGGVVVEPAGSSYLAPGTLNPLPGGGMGVQADIVTGGLATREYVSLIFDQDDRLAQNEMPYPAPIRNFTASSYAAEPLSLRAVATAPQNAYRSDLHGDPRHVVEVPAGAALIYRVGVPWADQEHGVTLEGHRYLQEPGMLNSESLYTDILVPGLTLNMEYLGGAGGELAAPGDYLFHDRRMPFQEGGTWNILRVTDPSEAAQASTDRITVQVVETGGEKTIVRGVVSTRPAGDTVGSLAVYEASKGPGECTGRLLGTVRVDRGNGRFELAIDSARAPSEICLKSEAGGVTAGKLGPELIPAFVTREPEVRVLRIQEVTEEKNPPQSAEDLALD